MNGNVISLYFHIPFCTKKCDYCHFYVLPDKEAYKQQLMQGFAKEWRLRSPSIANKQIATIYFGGGTPALLGAERIAEILSWLPGPAPTEITLEANPENITLPLMQAYAQAGINRVSIGIQTLDNALLRMLGRQHQAEKALEAVHLTAQAGLSNISIDLMYDLPGQTLDHWHTTLREIESLPITHLSLYNLTFEPHTVFFKKRETLTKLVPDEESSLKMYEAAIDSLSRVELQQYEISAFAKEGYQSKHNTGYWTARPFLGLGPSAFSYWEGRRFRNVAHLNRYCRSLDNDQFPIDFEEQLDEEARKRELLAVQLRLLEGVDLAAFEHQHGSVSEQTTHTLEQLEHQGYLEVSGGRLKLTKRGVLFYDSVAVDLI